MTELNHLIGPLSHPERFGGNIKDAFDVIVPSLPDFGFSGRPPRPYKPRKIDTIWLNGYGFPRFRGGPMYYAKAAEISNTIESINYLYRETNKAWWQPSEKLETI
ncbi:alpha/beta fold hydrolase [Grimontia sp. AD028]|uniref:alpha/beta fold hydrolase n=1 Tax=Grimontia sp. AD028 TaxID=1581149 RepID=UPI0018CDB779|nr:hypothetical protein [Grimontia sp. AD028]